MGRVASQAVQTRQTFRVRVTAALVAGLFGSPALAPEASAQDAAPSVQPPRVADAALESDATIHLQRGAEYYRRGEYDRAEIEFTRVAVLAPAWEPIRYNLAATAEAQGKLDLAIREYRAFLPQVEASQQYALELRIEELERRRTTALEDHRRKMTANWIWFSAAGVLTAGSAVMIAVPIARRDSISSGTWVTLATVGSVLGLVSLSAFIAMPGKIAKDRKHIRTMSTLTVAPAADRHGAGAAIAGRF